MDTFELKLSGDESIKIKNEAFVTRAFQLLGASKDERFCIVLHYSLYRLYPVIITALTN